MLQGRAGLCLHGRDEALTRQLQLQQQAQLNQELCLAHPRWLLVVQGQVQGEGEGEGGRPRWIKLQSKLRRLLPPLLQPLGSRA